MTLSFRTDRSWQTVQTQIRLLLEEQSDQGLHCLLFHWHFLDEKPSGLTSLFEFLGELQQYFGCPKNLGTLRYMHNFLMKFKTCGACKTTLLNLCSTIILNRHTVKFLNFWMPENFAVIYLIFKKRDQTFGYIIKKM